jgi:hypothetical protein
MVGNKLTSIAGYTSRVSELLEQVKHLNEAGNQPFEIKPEVPHVAEQVQADSEYTNFVAQWRQRCDQQHDLRFDIRHNQATSQAGQKRNNEEREFHVGSASGSGGASGTACVGASGGTIERSDDIEFVGVDIVSPGQFTTATALT